MDSLANDYAARVFETPQSPCLSLYQPTHRAYPQRQQDRIRFENLLKRMEESLRRKYPKRDVDPLLNPFRKYVNDSEFWNYALDGLAMLGAPDFFRVYRLQRPVPELVVVADSFHIKPLLRIIQSADRYQILGISEKAVQLFEGNRDQIDEVELSDQVPRTAKAALGREFIEPRQAVSAYGTGPGNPAIQFGYEERSDELKSETERFFRAVDRAVLEFHSRPSGLPLILAALPKHHTTFRRISHNPFLTDTAIDVHPASISDKDFRERVWNAFEPRYLDRLAGLINDFGEGLAKGYGEEDPMKIAEAAANGRVGTVLVEADRQIPGRLNGQASQAETGELADPDTDDILDDIAEMVLRQGGNAVVVPADRMPTRTGAAAIFRY